MTTVRLTVSHEDLVSIKSKKEMKKHIEKAMREQGVFFSDRSGAVGAFDNALGKMTVENLANAAWEERKNALKKPQKGGDKR